VFLPYATPHTPIVTMTTSVALSANYFYLNPPKSDLVTCNRLYGQSVDQNKTDLSFKACNVCKDLETYPERLTAVIAAKGDSNMYRLRGVNTHANVYF
jgi:hypothetical protein